MKKTKTILLILGVVLIVGILLLGFIYPFDGISLSTRIVYTSIHKDHLHLSGDYHYKVIQYRDLNVFASFAIIEFETDKDLSDLELIYAKDVNIQRYKNLHDSTSSSISREYLDYLPIDINCGCYTLFVINEFQLAGGYFYHVYFSENKLYIYYTSR